MTVDNLLPQTRVQLERIATADLVIGVTAAGGGAEAQLALDTVHAVCEAVAPGLRAVLVYPDTIGARDAVDGDSSGVTPSGAGVHRLPCWIPAGQRLPMVMPEAHDAFHILFTISAHLQARGCVLIGSQHAAVTADTVRALVQPVVDASVDLVLPCYPRQRFDGLIEKGIVYPLTRALFGRQIRCQLAADFGFSSRMAARLLSQPAAGACAKWFLPEAVAAGFEVRQVWLQQWLPVADALPDLSSTLAQVVGSLFLEVERTAPIWQKARGSRPEAIHGEPAVATEDSRTIDVRRMIESFQIGCRNLQDIWGLILPPVTLLELRRLATLPAEQFHLPDELWARILYDCALGYRLRVIGRDHLLRSMTPLYLAWVVSLVLQVKDAGPQAVADRIERACVACETQKPYFIARWRWPDRFNP